MQCRWLWLHLVLAMREETLLEPFNDHGLYSPATQVPACGGRIGTFIRSGAVVVHTTDMMPRAWKPLLQAWANEPGSGACAHFGIGRDDTQGVVQFVNIGRNANHAGGPNHGWYVKPGAPNIHPNLLTLGIELHGAGRLEWLTKDKATFSEDRKVLGEFSVAAGEVHVDELGRPWHVITQYQFDRLAELLRAIKPRLVDLNGYSPRPNAAYIKDRSKWDTSYAAPVSNSLLGHASLDTINRSDPGPQAMKWLNDFAQSEGWK